MTPHRANIINLLNLIAFESEQLLYQKRTPANVPDELVNQWFDGFYHPTDEQFKSEFSEAELASLVEFNASYDARDAVLPNFLDEMLKTKAWQETMAFARRIVEEHGWRGIEATYDDSPQRDRRLRVGLCRPSRSATGQKLTVHRSAIEYGLRRVK